MGIKVLFLYPNTFGMNMIPQAMALFSYASQFENIINEIFPHYDKIKTNI